MRRLEAKGISRNEQLAVLGSMALALGIALLWIVLRRQHPLLGDAPEYDAQGRFIADGKWWWSTLPYGEPHATAWKSPLYPAFVGIVYAVTGAKHNVVLVLQALIAAPATVGLTWWLARRLFTPRAAMVAAAVVAVHPAIWQWHGLLYSEAFAIPLTLVVLIAVLDRTPTVRRSAAVGALIGGMLLLRPTSMVLFAAAAVAWVCAVGLKRGAAHTALTVAVALLVVAPWTIRNAVVLDGFLPISIQDAAAYGTFNDEAANDPEKPYAWRLAPADARPVTSRPRSDLEFHDDLQQLAVDYIKEHPTSVVEAFFWNGITRTWDLRRPSHVLDEPEFDGRADAPTAVGLAIWWVALALALAGLWRWRARRGIVLPVLALALAMSVVFTTASMTRYRVTVEPLFIVLACSALPALVPRRPAAQEPEVPAREPAVVA